MIQLLPKKKIGIPRRQKFLFYFSLILLTILISIYLVFIRLDKGVGRKIQETNELISQTEKPEEIKSEQEVKKYEKKLKNFSLILEKHSYPSRVFPLLEKDTLDKVYFTGFNLDSETLNLDLNGVANDFQTLGQQIIIFGRDPLIRGVSLKNIFIVSLGMVKFSLRISLSPKSIMIQTQKQ